jgi:hypothetical protein
MISMIEELNKCLAIFKEATEKLIEALENNKFDDLDYLYKIRENQIDKIDALDYSKNEFKQIYYSAGLDTLEIKLSSLMNGKRTELISKIGNLSKAQSANKKYLGLNSMNSVFFNKKI